MRIFLIRGLPGSGKSTLGQLLQQLHGCPLYEADHAYIKGTHSFDLATQEMRESAAQGKEEYEQYNDILLQRQAQREATYLYFPSLAPLAHKITQELARGTMEQRRQPVIVTSTFSQPWEAQPYLDMAKEFEYDPFIIEAQNRFPNIHDVPQRQIDAMRARWLPFNY